MWLSRFSTEHVVLTAGRENLLMEVVAWSHLGSCSCDDLLSLFALCPSGVPSSWIERVGAGRVLLWTGVSCLEPDG